MQYLYFCTFAPELATVIRTVVLFHHTVHYWTIIASLCLDMQISRTNVDSNVMRMRHLSAKLVIDP